MTTTIKPISVPLLVLVLVLMLMVQFSTASTDNNADRFLRVLQDGNEDNDNGSDAAADAYCNDDGDCQNGGSCVVVGGGDNDVGEKSHNYCQCTDGWGGGTYDSDSIDSEKIEVPVRLSPNSFLSLTDI